MFDLTTNQNEKNTYSVAIVSFMLYLSRTYFVFVSCRRIKLKEIVLRFQVKLNFNEIRI